MSVKYTVVSLPEAEDDLTAIWLAGDSARRSAVTKAAHALELELRFDTKLKGQLSPTADEPDRRYLDYFPLRCFFTVSEPDRLVRILQYVDQSP